MLRAKRLHTSISLSLNYNETSTANILDFISSEIDDTSQTKKVKKIK